MLWNSPLPYFSFCSKTDLIRLLIRNIVTRHLCTQKCIDTVNTVNRYSITWFYRFGKGASRLLDLLWFFCNSANRSLLVILLGQIYFWQCEPTSQRAFICAMRTASFSCFFSLCNSVISYPTSHSRICNSTSQLLYEGLVLFLTVRTGSFSDRFIAFSSLHWESYFRLSISTQREKSKFSLELNKRPVGYCWGRGRGGGVGRDTQKSIGLWTVGCRK